MRDASVLASAVEENGSRIFYMSLLEQIVRVINLPFLPLLELLLFMTEILKKNEGLFFFAKDLDKAWRDTNG